MMFRRLWLVWRPYLVNIHVARQGITCDGSEAVDEVENPGRIADLLKELGKLECRQWSLLCGFEDDCTPDS